MKKILSAVLIMCVMLTGCRQQKQVDEVLLETAEQCVNALEVEEGRIFEVSLEDNGVYVANINGVIKKVKFKKSEAEIIKPKDISEPDKKVMKVTDKALNKILNYVQSSNIIKDKETVIEKLQNIPIKVADIDAATMYKDKEIYIGRDYQYLDLVSEWTILHSYVNALADITNGRSENQYKFEVFNEALTDIITATMKPEINQERSDYEGYNYDILLYLGCFGEKALKAYFYGYDEMYDIVGKDELDFYVYSFGVMMDNIDPIIYVNNFINKWAIIKFFHTKSSDGVATFCIYSTSLKNIYSLPEVLFLD